MTTLRIFIIATLFSIVSGCAGLELTSGRVVFSDEGVEAGISIGSHDRALIADYYSNRLYRKKRKKTPPGLAKRGGSLPHGLAKRDVLPRGLQGRGLPSSLERQLSKPASGYIRVVVGADIVLMNSNTRVVMDIYRDIVR